METGHQTVEEEGPLLFEEGTFLGEGGGCQGIALPRKILRTSVGGVGTDTRDPGRVETRKRGNIGDSSRRPLTREDPVEGSRPEELRTSKVRVFGRRSEDRTRQEVYEDHRQC